MEQLFTKEFGALVLMLVCLVISLIDFKREGWRGWFGCTTSICPSFDRMVVAVLLMLSLYVRGFYSIESVTSNWLLFALHALNFWFLASCIQAFTIEKGGFFSMGLGPLQFFIYAFLLSYLGMHSIAKYVWPIVCLLALCSVKRVSEDLGGWGSLFFLCGYLSLILQFSDDVFMRGVTTFKDDFFVVMDNMRDEVNYNKNISDTVYQKVVIVDTIRETVKVDTCVFDSLCVAIPKDSLIIDSTSSE
ncbi:MAG: hypothetical protein MJZ61_03720 [Bacteroidales bacterium]|nr:hypothetical protein [Bacteroidales bacterium]